MGEGREGKKVASARDRASARSTEVELRKEIT